MELHIDPEFKSLIPPLTDEEHSELEQKILNEGFDGKKYGSLITWNGILVDGHNRYEICKYHNIDFVVDEKEFENREQVKEWIIRNQFGRRNLTPFQRAELALQLKPLIQARAKENQKDHGGTAPGKSLHQNTDKVLTPKVDTYKEVAKIAGVSHDTVHKVDVIKKEASDEIKQKVASGEMSIRQGYMKTRNKEVAAAKEPSKPEAKEAEKEKSLVSQTKEESENTSLISIPEFQSAVNRFLAEVQPYVFMEEHFKALSQDEIGLFNREINFIEQWTSDIKKILGGLK